MFEYRIFQSGVPCHWNRQIVSMIERDNLSPGSHGAGTFTSVLADIIINEAIDIALGHDARCDGLVHVHESGPRNGGWHMDNWLNPATMQDEPFPSGRWGLLCYYPQDTPIGLGPTEIKTSSGKRIKAVGPAGTCLLMRHDVVHRATRNLTDHRGFMLKFVIGELPA